jgi:hypothetical protein
LFEAGTIATSIPTLALVRDMLTNGSKGRSRGLVGEGGDGKRRRRLSLLVRRRRWAIGGGGGCFPWHRQQQNIETPATTIANVALLLILLVLAVELPRPSEGTLFFSFSLAKGTISKKR